MDKNVKIVISTEGNKLLDMEEKLNDLFKKGYAISGGITVLPSGSLIAVMTKPF